MSIVVCILMAPAISISAGPLISPSAPSDIGSSYYTLEDIYNRLNSGTAGTPRVFTEPTTTAGAMYTLTEIMGKAPVVDNTSGAAITDVLSGKTFWGLRSGEWGPVTGNVAAGANVTGTALIMTIPNGLYSGSKTATATSSALLAENIKSGTTIFGVVGTYGGSALVPRTGQTQTVPLDLAPVGSDGNLHKGVTWPSPRFTNNNNGTVTDNQTGLIWLKNANCFGIKTWVTALTSCNALANGTCNLTDGSVSGSWRLPNRFELESLLDLAYHNPALSDDAGTGHQSEAGISSFTVTSVDYWSSSTRAGTPDFAWRVNLYLGYVDTAAKAGSYDVWPVRGGQ